MKKLLFILTVILFASCKQDEVEIIMNKVEEYKTFCYNDSTAFVFVTSTQNIDTDTIYRHKEPTFEEFVNYVKVQEK